MSDLISRQAAIDAVMELMPSLTTPDGSGQFDAEIYRMQEMFVDIWHVLNDMPSAQPEQCWIPCSEKLPENGHYYLKCSKYGNVDVDYYWDGFEKAEKYGEEVIAWQPLPEPYHADMRGEENA